MIAMDKNGLIMYFQYDSEGNVISMSFNGTRYYFVKNQQGDVEKIVNKQGVVVVTYKYDAWGNLCGMTDTSGVWGIGKMNPFRYRSYIYDDETGLYYLQSRYYDPVTGRFLNADSPDMLLEEQNNVLQYNVFSYVFNNPITRVDPDGYGTFLAGFGIHISLSLGMFTGGIEFVWFTSKKVSVGGRSRLIPYIYFFVEGSRSNKKISSLKTCLKNIMKNPRKLLSHKNLFKKFDFSISFFLFFGNSKMKSYKNYAGSYYGASITVWHVTAFTSNGSSGFGVGVGWSSSTFSVSVCVGRMYLMPFFNSALTSLYNSAKNKAKKAR